MPAADDSTSIEARQEGEEGGEDPSEKSQLDEENEEDDGEVEEENEGTAGSDEDEPPPPPKISLFQKVKAYLKGTIEPAQTYGPPYLVGNPQIDKGLIDECDMVSIERTLSISYLK